MGDLFSLSAGANQSIEKKANLDKFDLQPSLRDWFRYTLIVDCFQQLRYIDVCGCYLCFGENDIHEYDTRPFRAKSVRRGVPNS
jgi:hypothetical protein